MTRKELLEIAAITLPVAAAKTTIYTPVNPNYPWVASTCSGVVGQLHNTERDEARAKLIALALNNHDALVDKVENLVSTFRDVCDTHIYDGDHPLDCPYCEAIDDAQALLDELKK